LIDLYTYLPNKKSKFAPGSMSPDMFRILSSNVQEKASAEADIDTSD
jgi:hypothetical protein